MVNSVSFVDGLKYSNKKSEHYRFREISDRICKEHHLSVLEDAPFYGSKKKEYWLHKDGRKTHRDILKQDIEYCLTYAGNMRDFISQLHGLGYEYDWQRGSVKATGWERAVRLKNLGYTPERLKERLDRNFDAKDYYYQWNTHLPYQPKRYPLLELEKQLQFSVEHSRDTATVLVDALFLIIVTLLQLQVEDTPVKPLSPTVRQELSRLDELQKEWNGVMDPADPDFYEKCHVLDMKREFYRIKGKSWWPQELPNETEYEEAWKNPRAHDMKVDYVISHCAPAELQRFIVPFLGQGTYPQNTLTAFLQQVSEQVTFTQWFFGHYHKKFSLWNYTMIYEEIKQI